MYSGKMPFKETFGTVERGKPLAYLNSLMQLSFALNQESFAEKFKISSGHEWSVEVTKADQ
jgi:S-adenosylmethionine hydrolase